ncbi:MAG: SDR family oxidoreductase [Inquilinus sp.]|nr:SDR family oxidoreductase [Inquilinus sp.]
MELPRTPSFRLDGRRALVTGAGRGLGLAMATALAEAGAHVVLAARTEAQVEDAAAALREAGFSAEAAVVDVTDRPAFEALVARTGPFHVFVNNAGTNRPQSLFEITETDYDAIAGLNIKAALFCAQAVAKGMVDAGIAGSIINVSSQMGHVGGLKRSVYCATKFAVEGFTKSMALELGPHGIRVNSICPTFVLTELTRVTFDDPEMRAVIEDKIALGRVGQLEDLMGAAVFLASDASALMTGSALMLDGGWTAA